MALLLPCICFFFSNLSILLVDGCFNIFSSSSSSHDDDHRHGQRGCANTEQWVDGIHLRVEEEIGRGGFAKIYRAHSDTLGTLVALKVANRVDRLARNEVELLAKFGTNRADRIVQMFAHEEAHGSLRIVLELGQMDLATYWHELGPHKNPTMLLKLMRDAAEAVRQCHREAIHRDIKGPNLMCFQHAGMPCYVKLIDFNGALPLEGDDIDAVLRTGHRFYSKGYKSPEMVKYNSDGQIVISKKTDIWSFGAMFYKMLYGRDAIRAGDLKKKRPKIDYNYWGERNGHLDEMIEIIKKCLKKDPRERPTAQWIVQHIDGLLVETA